MVLGGRAEQTLLGQPAWDRLYTPENALGRKDFLLGVG